MNIGIDGNDANTKIRVGVGQYAFNLLHALSKTDKVNHYYIYLKSPRINDLPSASPNWQYRTFGPGKLWTKFALPLNLYLGGVKLDLFYTPSHYSPHFSPFPTIPTIHDLGYLKSRQQFNSKDIYQLVEWTKHSLFQSRLICCVSEFTKQVLIETYHIPSKKIFVVPNGVLPPSHISQEPIVPNQPYFLALGTLKPNKNYPFLIRAFSHYLSQLNSKVTLPRLIIAGKKGWLYDDIYATVKEEHLEHKVIFTDYITDSQKWSLLKNALSLVIPSTYEGFGIPAIESQAVGTPVIAANIPALVEVLGQTAIYIDPYRENSLVSAFKQIQDNNLRKKLIAVGEKRAAQFTWDKSAQALLEVFNNI